MKRTKEEQLIKKSKAVDALVEATIQEDEMMIELAREALEALGWDRVTDELISARTKEALAS